MLSLDRRFRPSLSDRETAKSFPLTIDEQTWQIYTDGSKQGNLAGAGFSIIRHFQEQKSSTAVTITSVRLQQCTDANHAQSTWVAYGRTRKRQLLTPLTFSSAPGDNPVDTLYSKRYDTLNSLRDQIGFMVFSDRGQ